MKYRTVAALAAAALTLAACGGGGSSTTGGGMRTPPTQPPPGAGGLGGLVERFDTLLSSAVHTSWSVSAAGETVADASAEAMICAGARCTAADGTELAARDLTIPAAAGRAGADLGSRGGFRTVTAAESFAIEEALAGATARASPEVTGYGFWGVHGFAALTLGSGPLSGMAGGVPFEGTFGFRERVRRGRCVGQQPRRYGGRDLDRHRRGGREGRLRAAAGDRDGDHRRPVGAPRVGVAIEVPGHAIGAPGWADMALDAGRFATGSVGSDYLAGNFHGPAHEEAWGVFDTADHVGAFGARRKP